MQHIKDTSHGKRVSETTYEQSVVQRGDFCMILTALLACCNVFISKLLKSMTVVWLCLPQQIQKSQQQKIKPRRLKEEGKKCSPFIQLHPEGGTTSQTHGECLMDIVIVVIDNSTTINICIDKRVSKALIFIFIFLWGVIFLAMTTQHHHHQQIIEFNSVVT